MLGLLMEEGKGGGKKPHGGLSVNVSALTLTLCTITLIAADMKMT